MSTLIQKQAEDDIMGNKYNKNFVLAVTLTVMTISPFVVNAASRWISTDSIGRLEYDSNKNGTSDVIIDSGDVNKLSQAENTNATDINSLQSKYESLITSLSQLPRPIKGRGL